MEFTEENLEKEAWAWVVAEAGDVESKTRAREFYTGFLDRNKDDDGKFLPGSVERFCDELELFRKDEEERGSR